MTRKAFLGFVVGLTLYYVALIVVALHGYSADPNSWSAESRFIKEFVAILTALPAAVLAFAVQQRLVFIKEVRDIYKECVTAVQDAIYFCRATTLNNAEKLRVLKGLSVAIDRVRGVFSDRNSTNYPADGLKKIYDAVSKISKDEELPRAHEDIVLLWKSTRQIFLNQIDRGDHGLTYLDQARMMRRT